ncbi:MAG: transcriptional activator RfaH [Alphaproteobacteria bacterium]|nr:transcriptional activator RfaH [Alphaproteobacteria bacterium]
MARPGRSRRADRTGEGDRPHAGRRSHAPRRAGLRLRGAKAATTGRPQVKRETDTEERASPRWYVAQTAPRKETVALQNLWNQGFEACCPRVSRTRRHARKFTEVREPVFPGYVFVGIDLSDQPWRSINGTLGVTRLLTDGAGPVPLQSGLVEEIVALSGDAGQGRTRGLSVGQDVRLRKGPFVDFVGRIVSLSTGQRVRVLLQLMNRDVVVGADIADLDLMRAVAT